LNDYKLRDIIESETHDIKTILYAKAFVDDEELDIPEDYV
jgi:His-Xaa-Ser system protein HxsD